MKQKVILFGLGIIFCCIVFSNNQAFALDKQDNLIMYNTFNGTNNCAGGPSPLYNDAQPAGSNVAENTGAVSTNGDCSATGIIGKAASFPTNIYDNLSNGTHAFNWLHNGLTNWSLSFWIYNSDSGAFAQNTTVFNSQSVPAGKGSKGITIMEAQGDGSTSDFMELRIGNGVGRVFDAIIPNSVPKTHAVWQHFVMTFKPSTKTLKLYLNGTLNATVTNATLGGFTTGDSAQQPRLPDINNQGFYANDEFSWWNTILTPADVTLLYNNTHGYNLLKGNGLVTSIASTPNTGPIGKWILVNGTDFGHSVNTDISIDGHLRDTIGHILPSFSDRIRMYYTGITTGVKTINATDETGSPKLSATTTFTVTTPNIFLNSTNGNVAKTVSVKGNGFLNDTNYSVYFDGVFMATNPAVGLITNSTGGFSGTSFVIPDAIAGSHTVKVTDAWNNNATASYNVTSSLSITPSSGSVGTLLIGNAKGFLASHNINIKFDGISKQNGTSNTVGTFSGVSFLVPSALNGNHTISATDGSHTANFLFNIPGSNPSITLNATSGKVGKNILVNGNGFNKSAQIKFYFNNGIIGTTPTPINSNSTGSFTGAVFVIPNLPLGSYTVKVNDTLGNFATKVFTINALSVGPLGAVSDLHVTAHNTTSITLAWSQPNLAGNTLSGYQINYTTPAGTPIVELINNTLSSSTNAVITPLFANTQYSFRVGVWAGNYFNPNGNIVTQITSSDFTPQNFTVGRNQGGILNSSNPSQVPMYFIRNDIPNTNNTVLDLIYPNAYNPTCSTFFEFAQTNKSYSNLANFAYDGNNKATAFNFNHVNNDIVDINCVDLGSHNTAKYVLTEPITGAGKFLFLQQIDNFRNGTYGTHGQFGALDFITLVAVLLSMIGLNRYDEAVGGIISVIMIGILSFFGIISILSTILSAAALILLLLVTTTRKN